MKPCLTLLLSMCAMSSAWHTTILPGRGALLPPGLSKVPLPSKTLQARTSVHCMSQTTAAATVTTGFTGFVSTGLRRVGVFLLALPLRVKLLAAAAVAAVALYITVRELSSLTKVIESSNGCDLGDEAACLEASDMVAKTPDWKLKLGNVQKS